MAVVLAAAFFPFAGGVLRSIAVERPPSSCSQLLGAAVREFPDSWPDPRRRIWRRWSRCCWRWASRLQDGGLAGLRQEGGGSAASAADPAQCELGGLPRPIPVQRPQAPAPRSRRMMRLFKHLWARGSAAPRTIVTRGGLLHRLRRCRAAARFDPAVEDGECKFRLLLFSSVAFPRVFLLLVVVLLFV